MSKLKTRNNLFAVGDVGRIIYEDLRNGRTGCRNTKCYGYLLGSKNLSEDMLRQVEYKKGE